MTAVKITFLGTGSGLCLAKNNYHSNMVLTVDGKHFGIDCGSHFPIAMDEQGMDINDFEGFYASHLHGDHVGGFEWVGFKRFFSPLEIGVGAPLEITKPKLYGNEEVLKNLWNKTLSGGMESIQNHTNTLENYYETFYIKRNEAFDWRGVTFQPIQTIHVIDDKSISPSFGLMITINGKKIFFTGDTQFTPNQLQAFYKTAHAIFHDCEIAKYSGGIHAQYHELCTLPNEFKKKMWLYHYDGKLPNNWKEQGFLGFLEKGATFKF